MSGALLAAGALLLLCPASAVEAQDVVADSKPEVSPVGVWVYPGGDAARSEMTVDSDGGIRFGGDFERYNPARWSIETTDRGPVWAITIPDLTCDEIEALRWHVDHSPEPFDPDSVDGAEKTVYYDLAESPCRISLAGWMFHRDTAVCSD